MAPATANPQPRLPRPSHTPITRITTAVELARAFLLSPQTVRPSVNTTDCGLPLPLSLPLRLSLRGSLPLCSRLTMEEANLIKERLQAITKKALREQWLMDGLSLQSAQEEEAMRLQAQDDQQQSQVLQGNIHRMEKEIEALEMQETTISANEQLILKRLKEVERTAEDIIKSYKPSQLKKLSNPVLESDDEQPKRALFAMEINVEKDMKTGESQILSTATVKPQEFQQKGVKVYDDGRKSVYALGPDGQVTRNGGRELTPSEVEELLRKATEKQISSDVEYHEPVFSTPYSRPSTPKRPDQDVVSSGPRGQVEPQKRSPSAQPEVLWSDGAPFQGDAMHLPPHIPHPYAGNHLHADLPPPHSPGGSLSHFTNGGEVHSEANARTLMSAQPQDSRENPRATLLTEPGSRHRSPSPSHRDNLQTSHNVVGTHLDSTEPVTMIFMGYQNVDDEKVTHQALGYDGAIQAELVVIGDEDGGDGTLSYHPDGYHSKIFQPHVNSRASPYLTEAKANWNSSNASPYSTTEQLQEPESGQSPLRLSPCPDGLLEGDGTEDPSATALRIRTAKLGKSM
ncbi:hypothetical protein JZ751_024990 [Albula glossodonta]|uniref:Palmdelphin n=1 Tax=Albula glossodonta TaxID=121402 RepID=A0A8T2PG46_9TELE|nr:hypothetical protein JZ751_024990 [Albula glossodonta]